MPAYEPTEPPPENTDFGPSGDEITAELLTLTRNFFHQASPAAREELRQFLTNHGLHPLTGLEAFLDTLQFTAEHHGNPTNHRHLITTEINK